MHWLWVHTAMATLPNIVLVVMDDVGWADVGYHGSDFATPRLDQLAQEGVRLERMYVQPQCSPTRASLLTGRHASSIGMQHWTTLTVQSTASIPKDSPTIAELLKAQGYDTHIVGKWHLGYSHVSFAPQGRGFDTFFGIHNGAATYYYHDIPSCQEACNSTSPYGDRGEVYDFSYNGTVIDRRGIYSEADYVRRVTDIIENASDPFFLYYSSQLIHNPLDAPDVEGRACSHVAFGMQYNRTRLCSMMNRLDENVGELIDSLKKNGKYNDTLVWILSDNGGMADLGAGVPGVAVSASSNWPLRGTKATLFEGGVRVPSIIAGGYLSAHLKGQTSNYPVHTSDVVPTIMSLIGTSVRSDGKDIWPHLLDANFDGREILINAHRGSLQVQYSYESVSSRTMDMSALIVWPWKLIVGRPTVLSDLALGYWTISPYEYVEPPSDSDLGTEVRLFNLADDEEEWYNVADDNVELTAQLYNRLLFWTESENYRHPQENVVNIDSSLFPVPWQASPWTDTLPAPPPTYPPEPPPALPNFESVTN